jgi:Uncharacterized protein conserved in bacteria
MTNDTLSISSPVGLVAGGGALPFAVGEALSARGITPVIFAIQGFCDPIAVARFKHHWISLGQLGRLTRLLRAEKCRDLAFIGTLIRPALSEIRLDWGNAPRLPRVGVVSWRRRSSAVEHRTPAREGRLRLVGSRILHLNC